MREPHAYQPRQVQIEPAFQLLFLHSLDWHAQCEMGKAERQATRHAMKKIIFAAISVIMALHLSASVVLTISQLDNGTCQIIALGNSTPAVARRCVLQSTSDFVTWTSISTNVFPLVGFGYGVTNIIHTTNAVRFYRIQLPP